MKRYVLCVSMLCLNISVFSMDVDNSEENSQEMLTPAIAPIQAPIPAPRPNSLPAEYCLFIKVDGSDESIGVPSELEKFFEEKIEIAKELNPERMFYHAREITAAEVHKGIRLLIVLLRMGEERLYQEILMPMPIDELIGFAHASTVLNLYALKNLIRDALVSSVKTQLLLLPSKNQKIAFLEKLSKLEDKYIAPLKNDSSLPFRKFFLSIRDNERLSPTTTKTITSVPLVEDKNFFLTAHGSHIFWIDNKNQLQKQDLKTLARSSFNPMSTGLKPNIDIHLVATPNGSHVCLWQDENRAILLNNITGKNRILYNKDPIQQVALSNNGMHIAFAGETGINLITLTDNAANLYTLPKPSQISTLKSCFFSHNGQFLYAHYKTGNVDFLYIYVTQNGHDLAQIKHEETLYHTYPGKEENSFWTLTNAGIKKFFLIDHEQQELFDVKIKTFIHTETNPRNVEYMLVNDDESFIILQTNRSAVELINVPANRTECIYHMFQTAVFGPNQKSLIAIENEENENGTYTIIGFPLLSHTVTTEINLLFDSLTLAQIIQLEQLMNIPDRNRMIQLLKEFLKQMPYNLQELINIYIFPGLINQRPQSPSDEPPAKRQKKS